MRTAQLVVLGSVVALVTIACGGSGGGSGTTGPGTPPGGPPPYGSPPPACTPSGATVCLTTSNQFDPASLTVAVGATVTWDNSTGVTHNVTFSTAGAPGKINNFSSGTRSLTFPTAGTYNYNCTIHGASMSGTIVVK